MDAQRMLINAIHPEEIRIAIVQDKELIELEVDSVSSSSLLKGNIYKAKINRIEPSLQAAFIDIGTKRNAFLQINDIHPSYFKEQKFANRRFEKIPIQQVLEVGQEVIVQVVKEERGLKGATLTTYLSLPGRYIVLMPGSDTSGISKKISNSSQRARLSKIYSELEIPAGIGLIIRTSGLDRSLTDLSRDLELQLKVWEKIVEKSQTAKELTLLYEETDTITRVIRDYFSPETREVVIDDEKTFEKVKEFVGNAMPRYRSRIKKYDNEQPIFSYYNIDTQVTDTYSPEVKLKSGGSIVIDILEALVAIDVNSGKGTEHLGIEETAYQTNLEAVDEIARQLRLRDLGGLVVIDFIDMLNSRHRSDIENKMMQSVKKDRAKHS